MTRLAVVLTSLSLAVAASFVPGVAHAAPDRDLPVDENGLGPGEPGSMIPSGIDRGYVRPPIGTPTPPPVSHQISRIIFVNRCVGGCTFTKSPNGVSDAINNLTWLGGAQVGSTISISEFSHSEQVWQDTLACIRDVYLPYGVTITDVDPGAVPHHEAVLAGRAQELPINGALGVAVLGAGACAPADNVISFSFANNHGPTNNLSLAEAMCWTVAQESAHSYGLEHEFDCSDPLTYLDNCDGPKYFRNLNVSCGEFAAAPCVCGGSFQNSHERLTSTLGVGTLPPPPVVAISMPVDGSTVGGDFSVIATAVDQRGVHHIELFINGWKWGEIPGVWKKTSSYLLSLPPDVPPGVMDIEVRACGDAGACASETVRVTRGAPCADASTCNEGQRCDDAGRCLWDPPTGNQGDACSYNEFCTSDVCADVGGGQMACTTTCFGGPNDVCPDPYRCTAPGGAEGVCGIAVEDEGGCCSAGGAGSSTSALLFNVGLGTLVGLIAIRRRRKRS